jgi:hypothetical protein
LERGAVAMSFEIINESLGFVNDREFFDWLANRRLTKDCTP